MAEVWQGMAGVLASFYTGNCVARAKFLGLETGLMHSDEVPRQRS